MRPANAHARAGDPGAAALAQHGSDAEVSRPPRFAQDLNPDLAAHVDRLAALSCRLVDMLAADDRHAVRSLALDLRHETCLWRRRLRPVRYGREAGARP